MRSLSQIFSGLLKRAWPTGVDRLALPALPGAAAALTAADLARRSPARFAIVVSPGQADLDRVFGDLCAFGRDSGVTPAFFPIQAEADTETAGIRMQVISMLHSHTSSQPDKHTVLVTSIRALLQPVPDPSAIAASSIYLAANNTYDFESLLVNLSKNGYERVPDVESPGQMAVRGGILDVWTPASAMVSATR